MDGYTNYAAQELITDIFRDLDRNNDGVIKKREFVFAASQCKDLSNLLIEAADKKKAEIERAKNPDFDAEKGAKEAEEKEKEEKKKKKDKKKKKKKKKKGLDPDDDPLAEYIAPNALSKHSGVKGFSRMSRRRSIF